MLSAGAIALNLGMADISKRLTNAMASQQEITNVVASAPERTDAIAEKIDAERMQRQKVLDDAVLTAQKVLHDQLVQDVLQKGGTDAARVVTEIINQPITADLLEGTSYDVTELHRKYPAMIHIEKDVEPTLYPSHLLPQAQRPNSGGYGNGFYWRDGRTLLTPAHVAEVFSDEVNSENIKATFDAAYVDVSGRFASTSPEYVVPSTNLIQREDIQGRLVSVVGIDPDKTSDEQGRKTYTGIGFCLNEKIARVLFPEIFDKSEHESLQKSVEDACVIILPPGENLEDEKGKTLAKGMSGSPAFVYIDGHYKVAGMFFAAAVIELDNKTLYVGLILPIDEIDNRLIGSRVWSFENTRAGS